MKTRHGIFFGFAVTLAAAIFTLAGCDNSGGGGGGSSSTTATYTGKTADGIYELTFTKGPVKAAAFVPAKGDSYVLTITIIATGAKRESKGTISGVEGSTFTLEPSKSEAVTFTVTVSEKGLANITGTITLTDTAGGTVTGPGTMTTPGTDGDGAGGDGGDADPLSVYAGTYTGTGGPTGSNITVTVTANSLIAGGTTISPVTTSVGGSFDNRSGHDSWYGSWVYLNAGGKKIGIAISYRDGVGSKEVYLGASIVEQILPTLVEDLGIKPSGVVDGAIIGWGSTKKQK